jgi:erythronate-4-phosphate dehydrogenase
MHIVADENIAQVAAVFGAAGKLTLLPGRAIDAASVHDADAVLVRSVTEVNEGLLAGSRCRYVGTATSGIDHIDVGWLRSRGIGFGWAQGCNADSVVDYVFSTLAYLSERRGFDWRQRSFGIVGCGQIGSRLARKLIALQVPVVIYDPCLDATHPLNEYFVPLETALRQDVLSFHTPLTRTGSWPTWHMLDATRLEQLMPDSILINAARGGVIDNAALLQLLTRQRGPCVVLDAWEGEPAINPWLLEKVALGTAHIAGYSLEGKLNGTRMIAADFSRHFRCGLAPVTGASHVTELRLRPGLTELQQLNNLILQAYDVGRDSQALRLTLGTSTAAVQFDLLRKHYPLRREFTAYSVAERDLAPGLAAQARALGFRIS